MAHADGRAPSVTFRFLARSSSATSSSTSFSSDPLTSGKTIAAATPLLLIFSAAGPQGLQTPLANEGYSLTDPSATLFNAPLTNDTNEPYSKISGDSNPIHISPYFSDFASLPATITHGLWSSAATRRYVERCC
jgi:hypothetical protein